MRRHEIGQHRMARYPQNSPEYLEGMPGAYRARVAPFNVNYHRALAIAFFYAVGTGVGGIVGPLMFGSLVEANDRGLAAIGFAVAAAVMAVGGIAELLFGVKAENVSLESIAKPLTAQ